MAPHIVARRLGYTWLMEASTATRERTGDWRDRVKAHRGPRYAYQAGVFLLGLLVIVACLGLWTFLPAPLAIPPMLIGLWLWSTEFGWARAPFEKLMEAGRRAREHAKERPVVFGVVTLVGLVVAAAGYWAFMHFLL